jgi:hypothetical protein
MGTSERMGQLERLLRRMPSGIVAPHLRLALICLFALSLVIAAAEGSAVADPMLYWADLGTKKSSVPTWTVITLATRRPELRMGSRVRDGGMIEHVPRPLR